MAKVKSTGVVCPKCTAEPGRDCLNMPAGVVHSERVSAAISEAVRRKQQEQERW